MTKRYAKTSMWKLVLEILCFSASWASFYFTIAGYVCIASRAFSPLVLSTQDQCLDMPLFRQSLLGQGIKLIPTTSVQTRWDTSAACATCSMSDIFTCPEGTLDLTRIHQHVHAISRCRLARFGHHSVVFTSKAPFFCSISSIVLSMKSITPPKAYLRIQHWACAFRGFAPVISVHIERRPIQLQWRGTTFRSSRWTRLNHASKAVAYLATDCVICSRPHQPCLWTYTLNILSQPYS